MSISTTAPSRAASMRSWRRRRGLTATARVSLVQLGERLETATPATAQVLEGFFGPEVAADARAAYRLHLCPEVDEPVA